MFRVFCELPNASELISGVKFERLEDGRLVSEEIEEEIALTFATIRGYRVAEEGDLPEPEMTPAQKKAVLKATEAAAQKVIDDAAAQKAIDDAAQKVIDDAAAQKVSDDAAQKAIDDAAAQKVIDDAAAADKKPAPAKTTKAPADKAEGVF